MGKHDEHRSDAEDKLVREVYAAADEVRQLRDSMSKARANAKASLEQTFDGARQRLEQLTAQLDELAEAHRREMEADLAALRNQVIQDEEAATVDEREQALKEHHEVRQDKLDQATTYAKVSGVEMDFGRSVDSRPGGSNWR